MLDPRIVACPLVLALQLGCGRVAFDEQQGPDAASTNRGPIGWWKLDDAAGSTAIDSSGHGISGTLATGLSWVPGRVGGAILVPGGADQSIDLGDPPILHLAGSMTIAAWVNHASFHTGTAFDEVIISRDDIGNSQLGWSLKGTEDCNQVEHWALQIAIDGTTLAQRCSNAVPDTGVWHHVAGVYDADAQTMAIYIDGALDQGTLTQPVPPMQRPPASAVHAQIGNANPNLGQQAGGLGTFDGMIDDVRVYDRPLGAVEIAAVAGL